MEENEEIFRVAWQCCLAFYVGKEGSQAGRSDAYGSVPETKRFWVLMVSGHGEEGSPMRDSVNKGFISLGNELSLGMSGYKV